MGYAISVPRDAPGKDVKSQKNILHECVKQAIATNFGTFTMPLDILFKQQS